MAEFKLLMPKLGESVQEATITKWFKKAGDSVTEDEPILEIATDKVDSEIPSPVEGIITQIFFKENDKVPVGEVIAIISLDGDTTTASPSPVSDKAETPTTADNKPAAKADDLASDRFYSPLVKSIARAENISVSELNSIPGSGNQGRLRKQDVMAYLATRGTKPSTDKPASASAARTAVQAPVVTSTAGDQIVEMDRMRRLIADHMVMSKQVSPHVTNFVEADVTNLALWRDKVKDQFQQREKEKLTFMPVFIQVVAQALKEFPGVNASVDGYNIILRKNVNIGVAVALPSGNLIVPVVKNADQRNLTGITLEMNRLARAARDNKLSPDDIAGGTFTISNFGSFRNLTGTPIINQPQVAILATGTIEKKPAVLETPTGDVIAIRHKMILSMTYDHRVIDGAMGGSFLRRIADLLEQWDINRNY